MLNISDSILNSCSQLSLLPLIRKPLISHQAWSCDFIWLINTINRRPKLKSYGTSISLKRSQLQLPRDHRVVKKINIASINNSLINLWRGHCGVSPRSRPTYSSPAEPPGKPKNTGAGSLSLLQRILMTQESNRGLLLCRQIFYQLNYRLIPHWERNKSRLHIVTLLI